MIELTDGYFITADERNYILARRKEKPTKSKAYSVIGYYNTLSGAGKGCSTRLLRKAIQDNDYTFLEALTALCEVEQRIEIMIDGKGSTLHRQK